MITQEEYEEAQEIVWDYEDQVKEQGKAFDTSEETALNIDLVSHSFTKEDMWDAWWASAIKTISFSGVDKDYERRCFEKFYKNKMDYNCG